MARNSRQIGGISGTMRGRGKQIKVKRPGSPPLFFICMLTILAIGWGNDYNSCLRQVPVRKAGNERTVAVRGVLLREAASTHNQKLARKLRIQAASLPMLHVPECSQLFPPTN